MGLKPGLKGLTQKEKNHRRAHLQAINDITFAECDNKGPGTHYTISKTNDIQKLLLEIGAVYGENYLTEKNFKVFNNNSQAVIDKLFSLIPKQFVDSSFVSENIEFLKKGIAVGCRRKQTGMEEKVDNSIACQKILDFMGNDTLRFIDSISHDEVQSLIFLGRSFNKNKMNINSNIHNVWILTGYYDALYDTLDKLLVSLKNKIEGSDNNERKVR